MGGKRISVDEGLALIRRNIVPLGTETISIERALGRVTAAALIARRTVPGFRAAAMDGFAVRSQDVAAAATHAPISLPIVGRLAAGASCPPLEPGTAVSIGTGAPVPEGADAVVMAEHISVRASESEGVSWVAIEAPVKPGLNVRQIGEDASSGRAVIGPGIVITPDVIAGMAAYGLDHMDVVRAARIALIVTGTELAGAASANPAAILDANGPMVMASARAVGAAIASFQHAADTPDALDAALDHACATDATMIVTTGGASHGEYDFVRGALERRGADIHFHGLSMRPGKPILFATLADGRPFFGLPGNPVSACIGMRFFVGQALRAMAGLPDERGMAVASEEPGRAGVSLFLRGRIDQTSDGRLAIDTSLDQRSHILSSLIAADNWLRVDHVGGRPSYRLFAKTLSL